MALSDLNVRLDLDTRSFNKAIRGAERSLAQMSTNLQGIGNSLSLAFTVPLAAIGLGAVRAAGNFEQLQRGMEATMTGAGYSIAQAAQELEKLREVAKAPGIDFEQAVKGSLRLQSVGLSADQARKTLAEFANGVAAAGGTAQNLDSVTTQLSQIIGKGKVLTQDLKIIKENMPSVSQSMVKAFGTADAEGIQALNISADEFVKTITEELAKAPRVVGGLANSMVNAQVSIQQAAAKLGDTLNKTFNITGNLDAFGAWVVDMADKFGALDEGTQKLIIGVGLFTAALGPAVRIGGVLVNVYGSGAIAFRTFQNAMNTTGSVASALTATMKGLSLATKLTIAGLAIGAVIALAAAFALLKDRTTAAEAAQKSLKQIQVESAQSIVSQQRRVEELVGVLKSEIETTDRKRGALDELQRLYPSIYKAIDIQNLKTVDLNATLNENIRLILAQAEANAIRTRLDELAAKNLDKAAKAEAARATILETTGNVIKGGLNPMKIYNLQLETMRSKFNLNEQAAITEQKALAARLAEIEKGGPPVAVLTDANKKLTDSTNESTKANKKNADSLSDIIDQLLAANEQEQKATLGEIVRKNPAFPPLPTQAPKPLQSVANNPFEGIIENAPIAAAGVKTLADKFEELAEKFEEIGLFGQALGEGIAAGLDSGAQSFKGFAQAALESIRNSIGALIQQYVATILANNAKFLGALGPAAVPISIGIGAAAGAAAKALLGKVTAFADGGIVYGPTLSLTGEYPGARSNPEVIAPLSDLQRILGNAGGGSSDVRIRGRLAGNDILLTGERAKKRQSRVQ